MPRLHLTWQYNGIDKWDTIVLWCKENIEEFTAHHETIFFYTDNDYTAFLLRWS